MRSLFLLCVIFLFSCSSDNNILVTNSGHAQGSYYHIKYMAPDGDNYKLQIDSIFLEIDSSLSIYKTYSLISKLNDGQNLKIDTFFNQVFNAAKKVYNQTEGYFDCSIKPLIDAWGFYDNKDQEIVIDSSRFKRILKNVGYHRIMISHDSLILPQGMSLDFNSIAQGFTVDIIAEFLESKSIHNYLVEVGGELLAKGRNADGKIWRIGVDKPSKVIDVNERFYFILKLENKALATSGSYRKFYEKNGLKYSHTIDPFTGFPVHDIPLSVTVIHDDCMLADAYATAFMAMGLNKSKKFVLQHPEIEVYLIYTDVNGGWKSYISPKMKQRIIN